MKKYIVAVLVALSATGCAGVHRTYVKITPAPVVQYRSVVVVREVRPEEMIILRREPLVDRQVTRIILRESVGSRHYDSRYCDEYDPRAPCYWKRHIK